MENANPHTIALFIGRFQPFHLGHLRVVKTAIKAHDKLFIAIGSSNIIHTPENPFTYEQRKKLILTALTEAKIDNSKYAIFPLPDINDWGQWPIHTTKLLEKALTHKLTPSTEITIYTGSQIVQDCFLGKHSTQQQKQQIPKIKFHNLVRRQPISATQIRELITKNSPAWHQLVPPATVELIQRFSKSL